MKTLLQKVFDELKYMDVVKNQSDFGEKMGFTKSYTSTLIKMGANLPNTVQNKLHKTYNISLAFLASGGKGSMFEGKTNKEVQDRLRGMLPESDVTITDLSDEINKRKKSDSTNKNTTQTIDSDKVGTDIDGNNTQANTSEEQNDSLMSNNLLEMQNRTIKVMESMARSMEDLARANLILAQKTGDYRSQKPEGSGMSVKQMEH